MNSKVYLLVLMVFLALAPAAAIGGGPPSAGAVYVMSNAAQDNEIIVFERDFQGRLKLADSYATAGAGSGGGIDQLGSQGALILSPNQRWLFAVNAGSDDISVFRVRRHELDLIGNFDSGGAFPVSLALYHNLLYVLNSGSEDGGPNITGFRLNRRGELTALPDSTRLLGPGGFHQVGFNPRGDALVVTQGDPNGANQILVFGVDEDGLPDAAPTVSDSHGVVPFGFIFDWRGHLLVAEAGSGAVSSYRILDDNTLELIDGSVSNGNIATCWIAGTWFGAVFTANTGSGNISRYRVNAGNGHLSLRDAVAASGNKPIDMAVTASGRYLYALNAGDGTVGAFRISANGSLKSLGAVKGLPLLFAQGIAVR
jgi:6-phosphogluconolactonase (cycloisomerase 2 family)